MKALREAVEVGRRAQELSEAEGAVEAVEEVGVDHEEAAVRQWPPRRSSQETFEGTIQVEIGPLGDYSQLVGIEDAIERLGATRDLDRALLGGPGDAEDEPRRAVDLLRELEEHSPLEFHVRRAADDNLVLDVDDEDPENRAA